jgi:hypothetical protein
MLNNDKISEWTKADIEKMLEGATETILIDIPDDLFNTYSMLADKIGVSVDTLVSAVVTNIVKDLKDEDTNSIDGKQE